ncbi:MAG: hypothetical protein P9X24_12930 [Candidatus Hatepunaea meridiana]|nr:hypothetical protein [Candidatus Hatepunaea meridiana]
MVTDDIIVLVVGLFIATILAYWILTKGGAEWLEGSFLGIFFQPHPSRWSAESYKLWALAKLLIALIALIIGIFLYT